MFLVWNWFVRGVALLFGIFAVVVIIVIEITGITLEVSNFGSLFLYLLPSHVGCRVYVACCLLRC